MSTAQFTHVGMRSIAGFEFLHLRLVYYLGLRKQLKEAARLDGWLLCAELARRGSESLKVRRTVVCFQFSLLTILHDPLTAPKNCAIIKSQQRMLMLSQKKVAVSGPRIPKGVEYENG